MSKITENLALFVYDTQTDGKEKFNIDKALNENFEKIDSSIGDLFNVTLQVAYDRNNQMLIFSALNGIQPDGTILGTNCLFEKVEVING